MSNLRYNLESQNLNEREHTSSSKDCRPRACEPMNELY